MKLISILIIFLNFQKEKEENFLDTICISCYLKQVIEKEMTKRKSRKSTKRYLEEYE
ncbi:hypothetical protein CP118TE_30940 (plasmid) [Clostridium perfringens E]|nr:hypothetical protein CP118TE_30940 [Clostridium perfringens E]